MIKVQKKQILCMGLLLLFATLLFSLQFTKVVVKNNLIDESLFNYTQGPEISNVIFTPDKPEWLDNVSISAQITDPWGISEVWLNYDADNDDFAGWGANFTMPHIEDDQYNYTILSSIWDSPQQAHGSHINFTIYAKNGQGEWSQSGYYHFYMNDTVKPIVQIHSLTNNSWLSRSAQINFSIYEAGSGIKAANLSIYTGNGTFYKRFSTLNALETFTWNASLAIDYNISNYDFLFGFGFTWDVSSLPDYDSSTPTLYYTMNLTVFDKAIPTNKVTLILDSIMIDNTNPSIAFLNSYKNLSTVCQDNLTISNNIISATNFVNNHTSTHVSDSNYHSFDNDGSGFLQVAYGLNLSSWNLTADMLNLINITLEGKIGYSNSSILEAGWKIWNWVDQNFTIIDSTIFNNTDIASDCVYLTISNVSMFIKDDMSRRIEIFFYVNTTGPLINASIDYILYDISYYEIDDWYNLDNPLVTLQIKGDDLLSFDHMDLFYQNITLYTWNNSGEYLYELNTSLLPDEGLLSINLTVYDLAGNSNSTSIVLNIDFFGPIVNIISPEHNSTIGESGIVDLIIPVELSGYDIAKNFQRMELWIDGQIGPVLSGQLGQMTEYDEYGNLTYEQSNATWFEEGSYTYYWNASKLIHGTIHELLVRSYDGFGNPNELRINVTMATFKTNITIIDVRENYTTSSDFAITLEFSIINYGNSTLKDFTPQIIIPSQWSWSFVDVDSYQFQFLSPGETVTFKIAIIPRSVQATLNQSIDLVINCQIIENLTQIENNFTHQFRTYIIVQPKNPWLDSRTTVFIFMSIALGLGAGFLSFLIYRYLREVSKQPEKPPEKPKRGK